MNYSLSQNIILLFFLNYHLVCYFLLFFFLYKALFDIFRKIKIVCLSKLLEFLVRLYTLSFKIPDFNRIDILFGFRNYLIWNFQWVVLFYIELLSAFYKLSLSVLVLEIMFVFSCRWFTYAFCSIIDLKGFILDIGQL